VNFASSYYRHENEDLLVSPPMTANLNGLSIRNSGVRCFASGGLLQAEMLATLAERPFLYGSLEARLELELTEHPYESVVCSLPVMSRFNWSDMDATRALWRKLEAGTAGWRPFGIAARGIESPGGYSRQVDIKGRFTTERKAHRALGTRRHMALQMILVHMPFLP
jgi:hypothetical protein